MLALLVTATGCRSTPPEQALRETIAQMRQAGEEHRVSDFMDSVAEDFGGPEGMDRKGLQRFLTLVSLQNRELGATLGPLDLEIIGERARVDFTLAASGGAGWLPERGQIYEVSTGWRLEGGEWKLISASWRPQL